MQNIKKFFGNLHVDFHFKYSIKYYECKYERGYFLKFNAEYMRCRTKSNMYYKNIMESIEINLEKYRGIESHIYVFIPDTKDTYEFNLAIGMTIKELKKEGFDCNITCEKITNYTIEPERKLHISW